MKTPIQKMLSNFAKPAVILACFMPFYVFADTEQPAEATSEVPAQESAQVECPEGEDVAMMGGMGGMGMGMMGTGTTGTGMMGTMGGMGGGMGMMGTSGGTGGMGMMNTDEDAPAPDEAISRSPCAKKVTQ